MRALFITTRKILPLNDGAFIYTYGILQYLKSLNFEIHFVSFYETTPYSITEINQLKTLCFDVSCVKLIWQTTALNLSFKYPNNIRKYTRNRMKRSLKEKRAKYKFDIVVVDHLQMFEYAYLFPSSKIVLIEHNVEANIWFNFASKCNGLIKKLVTRSAKMTYEYEKKAITFANSVVSITQTDLDFFKQMNPRADVVVMHPYNMYPHIKTEIDILSVKYKILFIGSYGWFPNQEAAGFLVEEIMPRLRRCIPEIKLYLVGKDPTSEMVAYGNSFDDIFVTGMVDSVDPYIKECDLFINAMFSGGGMNVKMMEAMGKGIPVISSRFGCRGIAVENRVHVAIFDSVDECIELITWLMNDNQNEDSICYASFNIWWCRISNSYDNTTVCIGWA